MSGAPTLRWYTFTPALSAASDSGTSFRMAEAGISADFREMARGFMLALFLFVIRFQGFLQDDERLGEVFLVEDIGEADFVPTVLGV